jgi:hypothetical protein
VEVLVEMLEVPAPAAGPVGPVGPVSPPPEAQAASGNPFLQEAADDDSQGRTTSVPLGYRAPHPDVHSLVEPPTAEAEVRPARRATSERRATSDDDGAGYGEEEEGAAEACGGEVVKKKKGRGMLHKLKKTLWPYGSWLKDKEAKGSR